MLVDDVMDLLTTGGAGTKGTDIFGGDQFPDTPSTAVMVRPYGGLAPLTTFGDTQGTATLEYPRIQIETRASGYVQARAKMELCFQALQNVKQKTINGKTYQWMYALQSEPIPLGKDDQQRTRLALNFECFKAHSTS